MVNLSVEIDEEQSSIFEDVLEQNPGWNKALVVRALLGYFLKLNSEEQTALVKNFRVVKRVKRRI